MTPRIGLVLGAGGVAGHGFHAGVLAALAEATGWDSRTATLILGTSAGSIVGTGLRLGLAPSDVYARVTGDPLSDEGARLLDGLAPARRGFEARPRQGLPTPAAPGMVARFARRPWTARPGLVMAGLLPEGRVDPASIGDDVDRFVAHVGREPRDLWVVAARLGDGQRIVFGRDDPPGPHSWGQAVAASCAIPGFFAPVRIRDTRLVDGGAHSPTNADLFGDHDFDAVIVSSPMSATRSARLRSLDAPIRAAYRLRLAGELQRLARRGVPVLTFQPPPSVLAAAGLNAMDPAIGPAVARASRAAALERLARSTPVTEMLAA